MIYDNCPDCWCIGLRTVLAPFRHNQQICYDCCWRGEVHKPEARHIATIRNVNVGMHGGFTYEIFDCFGQTYTTRAFTDPNKCRGELKETLDNLNNRDAMGGQPWTGVLWPDKVLAEGELVR